MCGDGFVQPQFGVATNMRALSAYFDIAYETAEVLFDPGYYDTNEMHDPQFVIERMQLLLAADEDVFCQMMSARFVPRSRYHA